jgi:hypothetical protein
MLQRPKLQVRTQAVDQQTASTLHNTLYNYIMLWRRAKMIYIPLYILLCIPIYIPFYIPAICPDRLKIHWAGLTMEDRTRSSQKFLGL